jgi:hypothetical protein
MPRRRTLVRPGVLGLVAAALYCDWVVLEPTVGRDLSPAHSFVSEMAAQTHPYHVLLNAADVVAGVCLVLFALDLLRVMPLTGVSRWAGAGCVSVFGCATAVNAFFPMTCVPSQQPRCPAAGVGVGSPLQDQVATACSVLAAVAVVLSMLAFARALRDVPGWQRLGKWALRFFAVATPLTVVVGLLGLLEMYVGLPQRALLLVDSSWIATLAVSVLSVPSAARVQLVRLRSEFRRPARRTRSRVAMRDAEGASRRAAGRPSRRD